MTSIDARSPKRAGLARLWSGAAAAVVLVLGACMADNSGVGSGGSGSAVPSVSVGAISGFGSIIINGIRHDDSQATITADDGSALSSTDLKLGRVARVQGTTNPVSGAGVAGAIQVRRALVGPVQAIDTSLARITILGRTLDYNVATVLDAGIGSYGNIRVGDRLTAYGLDDVLSATLTATRIEAAPAAGVVLQGVVQGLQTAGSTFQLWGTPIDYQGASLGTPPLALADGLMVRVRASQDPVGGTVVASVIELIAPLQAATGDIVSVEGRIANYTSRASFTLQGYRIDASQALLTGDSAVALAADINVEITGTMRSDGVVAASVVRIEASEGALGREFEAHGTISNFVNNGSFVVKGTLIDASSATIKPAGTVLANGLNVEVEGRVVNNVVRATQVEIER